jgi:hypothetical protein
VSPYEKAAIAISLIAVIVAIATFIASRRDVLSSKEQSEKALAVANAANGLAEQANALARQNNDIIVSAIETNKMPEIILDKWYSCPSEYQRRLFRDLSKADQAIIRKTLGNAAGVTLSGQDYLLFNLVTSIHKQSSYSLLLCPFRFRLVSDSRLEALYILHSYSIVAGRDIFPQGTNANDDGFYEVPLAAGRMTAEIRLAYFCGYGGETSINVDELDRVAPVWRGDAVEVVFWEDDIPQAEVRPFVNFSETAYLLKSVLQDGSEYYHVIRVYFDNAERLHCKARGYFKRDRAFADFAAGKKDAESAECADTGQQEG